MATKDDQSGLNLTKQDLQDLLTAAVRAGTLPSEEELAAIEAEKSRVERRRKLVRILVARDREAKAKRQAACRHRKPDGEETIGGQPFSDGMIRHICLRCQKIMYEAPTPELEVAKTEIQRLIDQGKVRVRKDGTIEMYENRMSEVQK